jgi:hypothetical protein
MTRLKGPTIRSAVRDPNDPHSPGLAQSFALANPYGEVQLHGRARDTIPGTARPCPDVPASGTSLGRRGLTNPAPEVGIPQRRERGRNATAPPPSAPEAARQREPPTRVAISPRGDRLEPPMAASPRAPDEYRRIYTSIAESVRPATSLSGCGPWRLKRSSGGATTRLAARLKAASGHPASRAPGTP